MKKVRKLTAILLALVMVLALAAPALAVDPTYTITINNEQTGHTYEAYQVFAGTVSSDDLQTFDPDNPDAVASDGPMLGDVVWGSGVKAEQQANLLTALKADATLAGLPGMDTAATAADVAKAMDGATAEAAAAFAAVVATRTADGYTYLSGTKTESTVTDPFNDQYTITGLAAGYYLVMDQNGSLQGDTATATDYIVQVLGNVTMEPKDTDIPTLVKKVYDEEFENQAEDQQIYGDGYNDVADWEIGNSVPFKLIGSIPDMSDYDTYEYIFHDTLEAGFTLEENTFEVFIARGMGDEIHGYTPLTAYDAVEHATDYDYILNVDAETNSFTVTFENLKENRYLTGEHADEYNYVVVTYDAKLDADAVIGGNGNLNTSYLEFSNDPNGDGHGQTEEDEVIVFTYGLQGTKVDGQELDVTLANASFVLINEGKTRIAEVDENGRLIGWVAPTTIDPDVPTQGASGDVGRLENLTEEAIMEYAETHPGIILTSDENGLFEISGVDDDVYYLREVQAPAGYNRLPAVVEINIEATTYAGHEWDGNRANTLTALDVLIDKVDADPDNNAGDPADGMVDFQIQNNRGATLPETGGMGTTLFYIIGGLLVVGAGILLVVRIRMKAHNE